MQKSSSHFTSDSKSGYYENYIQLGHPRSWCDRDSSHHSRWECFLRGEYIGEITYREHCATWEKPYEADVCYNDQWSSGKYRTKHVSWHDTLYSAKLALLEPARKFLDEISIHSEHNTPVAYIPETDYQFYPTPSFVAGRLLSGVEWDRVNSVLEPSAGRGDLLEYAIKRGENDHRGPYYSRTLSNIDCIELDSNLRALLTGKGYRVVHDDFLSFHTRKQYDLILMNPPFSEGDMHLLHAIDLCRNGGQIACILNAETIRNPYTSRRKALLKELHRYNASIRYMENAFDKAVRGANVDIALINVTIPYSHKDTSIWDDLEKARKADLESEERHEIAPANMVERLIREYDMMCEAGIRLMQVYNGVAPRILTSKSKDWNDPIIRLYVGDHKCNKTCGASDLNEYLERVRSRYWRELFDLPELREKMTSAMRDEYSQTISKMKDYEFSQFNVRQVLEQIMGQLIVGVEEAIIKCFDKLSAEHSYNTDVLNENIHYYNGWKTNKAHLVNSKCIIPTYGCFSRGYKYDKYGRIKDTLEGLDVHGCFQTLDDLEKALDYLDKGETSQTSLEGALMRAAAAGKSGSISCKYFAVTFYKKGTCHIKFHEQKIVDRLNIYVGRQKAWLPPTYGSVHYDEMDEESRRVVDDFQGREKYEEIMRAPSDYIIETKNTPLLLSA